MAAAPDFSLPDEAVPHERTFMQWPVDRRIHRDASFLDRLQTAVADVANAVARFEPVVMLMHGAHEASARRKLGRGVEIWPIPTNDLWCRDSGPLFVADAHQRKLAIAGIRFNGWGRGQPHDADARIAGRIAERLGLPLIDAALVGEAGGVDSDGDGTLMAHESSWVNDNRNRETRATIEQRLLAALGARRMIWAPGLKGHDITDYHIDALARFTGPGRVLIQLPPGRDKRDPWTRAAYETYEILRQARDARGRALQVEVLADPAAPRVRRADFVASYVNFYVCNGAVIAPRFGDREADAAAHAALARAYPGREVVALDVDPIGEVGGGIHCATQQQPVA